MPFTFYSATGQQLKKSEIADNAVTTAKIADDAVTLAKMASGTDGQIITYDASGNPVAVGPGTDGQVLTSTGAGSPPAFETASSGAVTRIAGDTNEATTTSTGDTDLLTLGRLSVPVTTPIHYILDCRKSTGYADDARAGLKINATKIGGRTLWETGANNEAQSGVAHGIMGSRVTNYFGGISLGIGAAYKTDLTRRQVSIYPNANDSNAQPDATCTSWIVVGSVANSGITLGVDEAHLYTMAVS